MKNYYLDTNICIAYMRGRNLYVIDKVDSYPIENIKIPAIVEAELAVGALKSIYVEKSIKQVQEFCDPFEIVPFDENEAWVCGNIRADLERKGIKIGYNDTLIAATVLSRGGVLVTNNVKEFSRVEGLRVEDWTQE